jgi:hypothetical protein
LLFNCGMGSHMYAISRDKSEPVAFVNIPIKLRVLRLRIASAWQTRSV